MLGRTRGILRYDTCYLVAVLIGPDYSSFLIGFLLIGSRDVSDDMFLKVYSKSATGETACAT